MMKYDHIKAEAGKRDMNRIIIKEHQTEIFCHSDSLEEKGCHRSHSRGRLQ